MAIPKQRKSKSKSRSRRANYLKLKLPTLSECQNPNCDTIRLPHTVCPTCGYYKNKIVVNYSE